MVLKELEIQGFKSFANKTKISFEDDITGVVGPNGCGKSNILDAMKWVLGEKSVKSIRGEKMQDVIFSGTEKEKPSGFAEVSLTLNNTERLLDIDLDSVKIGRRLYRDGQSQYILNDKRVARKDIDMLLMDTGIGKSSYSFMEQGKIDQIISVKPEDRRQIFEEAAGISKFKSQKEESEKNLENTQLNIVRLQDILYDLEREVKSKSEQAEKTKIFNELVKSQKEYDLRLRYYTLLEMQKKNADLEVKLQRKQKDKDKIQQKYYLLEEKINIFQEEKEKLQKELHQKDIENRLNKEKIEQWKQEIISITKRKKESKEQKENIALQMNKQEKRIEIQKQELDKQNQFTIDLLSRQEQAESFLKNLTTEIQDIHKKIKDLEDNLLVTIRKEKMNKTELSENRKKLEVSISQLLDSLKIEKEKWPEFELNLNINKAKIIELIEKCKDNKNILIDKIKSLGELPQGLKHLLFEQGGIYSQKQRLDEEIENIVKNLEELDKKKIALQGNIEFQKEFLSKKTHEKEAVSGDIKAIKLQKTNIEEKEKNLKQSLSHEEDSLNYLKTQYNQLEVNLIEVSNKERSLSSNIEKMQVGLKKEIIQIDNIEKKIEKTNEKKIQIQITLQAEKPKLENINSMISELEMKIATYLVSQEALIQSLYDDYNLTLIEVKEKLGKARIIADKEKEKLVEVQKKIEKLGPVNALAIEDLNAVKSLYDHHKTQLDDIIQAKKDILDVIDNIQKKSETMFLESFNQISKNFENIFKILFKGGKVSLTLENIEQPLSTGIDIIVHPPGKTAKNLLMLSGGEKTMTAISLMFAIYMVKSSPFCVLDEIDAPLDDQNLKRFLLILDDFVKNTQFILITHNKLTMAKATSLFGVTMEEAGISKILSVNLKTAKDQFSTPKM